MISYFRPMSKFNAEDDKNQTEKRIIYENEKRFSESQIYDVPVTFFVMENFFNCKQKEA